MAISQRDKAVAFDEIIRLVSVSLRWHKDRSKPVPHPIIPANVCKAILKASREAIEAEHIFDW